MTTSNPPLPLLSPFAEYSRSDPASSGAGRPAAGRPSERPGGAGAAAAAVQLADLPAAGPTVQPLAAGRAERVQTGTESGVPTVQTVIQTGTESGVLIQTGQIRLRREALV